MNKEIWKDVKGYEGLYQISNLGRVKSLRYNKSQKEKILKAGSGTHGYQLVVLCKKGKHKTTLIHRAVAYTFIPNPNNFPDVNHKDENKSNNCVENLEWCTKKYNQNYGNRNKKCSEIMGKQVEVFKDGISFGLFKSVRELEKKSLKLFGTILFHGAISLVCNGKQVEYKGFTVKYIK